MKLNLLPATVSKGAKARTAWIGSVLLILAGVGASAFMITKSGSDLREIKQLVADERPKAERAYARAIQADTIIVQADGVVRNKKLADAMIAHNNKYPALYTELLGKIPSFFRVTQMSATPINETTSQINLQGTLETYQQYADLMLALFRFKGTTAVGRGNYVSTEQIVPAITEVDQTARPRRADEAPIPDDPLQRLTYFQNQASTPQFTGTGNFGTATDDTRFALPNSSLIQVTMIVSRDLRVPDVRQTLAGGGGGGGTAPAPGGFPGGIPGVPGGRPGPGGAGGAPPSGGGGAGSGAGDFE
ncbi:MAG: hypothetical protein ACO1SV_26015 [Fimbriimonas sp.]